MSSQLFMLMAGGTGGHIFPALAVAQALQERGHRVLWLGSEGAMETRLVPQHGIRLETIAIKGVRGNGIKRKLLLPFTLLKTIKAAWHIIKRNQVDAVIGFGGFVTVPGGVAAKLAGIPVIIHEQNAVAGLANKLLSRWARRVLFAFPRVFPDADGLVGNPVRADIAALPVPDERFKDRSGSLHVLVVGGSLGADALNNVVPEAVALLPPAHRPHIIHQSGRNKLAPLQRHYAQLNLVAECVEFIDDMVSAYRDADVVVCRAGALTIAELTAAGVGAFLVPYPYAVDDHQTANARFLVQEEAAVLLVQSHLDASSLAAKLMSLSRGECLRMANHARALAMPNSAAEVAEIAIAAVH